MSQLLDLTTAGKVSVRYSFPESLPSVRGDETQLRQVVMNLILNAVEAVSDGSGQVTVTTGEQYCDQSYLDSRWVSFDIKLGNYAFVEVSDNGSGMDETTRARIFEPFFTTKFVGRGLGMSAVHGIVTGHDGAIILYTELGKSTSFKVLLPALDTAASTSETTQTATFRDGSGRVVLIVNDDAAVCDTVERILQR